MRALILSFLVFLLAPCGHSQYFSTGQDPASVKWRQIKTARYQLIYPAPFEKKAQYLANIMSIICRNETTTLSAKVPRIPVILHTRDGDFSWAMQLILQKISITKLT